MMILAPNSETGPSLMLIEAGLTLIAVAGSFCVPQLASPWFLRIERIFARLARKRHLSVAITGATALLLRLAILPFCPIPLPFVHDDFSFLLAGNTFALGRLANPTPAMWRHFESFQITMQPTYMSMYFPAQGLVLAAGKAFFGHSWFGLLCVTALMCAAICWMLQAWLPPTWALLGGMLAVLRLGLFSYWINTYSGGGSVAALGGALVLGALPRLMRTTRLRDGLLLAAGIILVALSRPFEGTLLCIPVAVFLGRWIFFGTNRPSAAVLLCRAAMPVALIVAAVAWLGYYDYRAFGNPLTLPYTVDRATYAVAPYWVWQAPRPEPVYRHKVMRDFYVDYELSYVRRLQTLRGFVSEDLFFKPLRQLFFYAGIALASASDYAAPCVARPANPISGCVRCSVGRRNLVWNFPHPPLSRTIYRGLLCYRPASHASSAPLEAGPASGWINTGAKLDHCVHRPGWDKVVRRAASFAPRYLAKFSVVFHLARPRSIGPGARTSPG